MNIIIIIILAVVLVLTFFVVTVLLALFQKHRKLVLNDFTKDLSKAYKQVHFQKINSKQLPINSDEIKEDIYFYSKAVIGEYEKDQKIISEKNWSVSNGLENNKIKIFYNYKIINLVSSKFIPLNKIDLFLSKTKMYLFDPLEPETMVIKSIANITVFWEKNSLIQRKDFFPGVAFTYQKKNYFLMFQTYRELLKFLSYLNLLT